ncbi:hypothetical protein EGR_07696 [Echinococcus granulosus]|uniref:Uncharacterized protein n=1 Tax=Echinococcus granulosus TaxID=6210 RepID=W6UVL2_ECHGR|nr:hypothetical protein EGR_07696 [Echinococcus granulosus]EUB57454.1 hypothetical protein EGR_07696 [Echinococcus granulosus]
MLLVEEGAASAQVTLVCVNLTVFSALRVTDRTVCICCYQKKKKKFLGTTASKGWAASCRVPCLAVYLSVYRPTHPSVSRSICLTHDLPSPSLRLCFTPTAA